MSGDNDNESKNVSPIGIYGHLAAFIVLGAAVFVVYSNTYNSPFLFDDMSHILKNYRIDDLSQFWPPSGMRYLGRLSFALTYRFSGTEVFGYHVVNIALHAANAALVWLFLRPLLRSDTAATLGAMVFAVHPLQLEAVTLAIQRKTLLSGMFFILTFLFYQRFFATERRAYYLAALLSFVVSVLAKPITVPLPVALLFYEHHFVRARPRLLEKVPFFLVALLASWVALAASHDVAAVKGPHGGNWLAHALMVSRVSLEYVAALFLPANLAPIYYYQNGSEYAALNWLALAAIAFVFPYVIWRRDRLPWTYFCLGWFTILLLPQSNIIPLAQLRPDRYLYLSLIGFALWLAAGYERSLATRAQRAPALRGAALAFVAALAALTFASAATWRDDVTAWSRVVERHPWCGTAHQLLGVAHFDADDPARAAATLEKALRLNRDLPEARIFLARSYQKLGRAEQAAAMARSFLEQAPADARGVELLNSLGAAPRS